MRNPLTTHRQACKQHGISLIEMLVGIAIGLVCVLVILQLLSSWEQRKRTTTSGTDAQISGTLGSFSLDRDLRLAGYGFGQAADDVMGKCTLGSTRIGLGAIDFGLRPVSISQDPDPAKPDTISVMYGNSPIFVTSQPLLSSAAEAKTLKSRDGFLKGDVMLIAGNTPVVCRLVEITELSIADAVTVKHEATSYTTAAGIAKSAEWNVAGGTGATFTTGRVFNFGPAPVRSVWTVNTTTHTLTRYNSLAEGSDKAVDVASDVVTLKAQYGIDANNNGVIDNNEWTATTTAGTDWTKVRALRFAMLIRSRQFERPDTNGGNPVTPTVPAWSGSDQNPFVMSTLDGTSGSDAPNDWRNYRYRIYEETVPLRNMIWGASP